MAIPVSPACARLARVGTSADRDLTAGLLDALPVLALLLDRDLRIVHASAGARTLLGVEAGAGVGEALGCLEAKASVCGQGPRCGGCAVRRAAEAALAGERARTRGFLLRSGAGGEPADLHVLALAAPIERGGEPYAAIALLDVDEILVDQGVVHVCGGCGRVEDEGQWHGLHRFLEDRLGLEVDGEPCAECASSRR